MYTAELTFVRTKGKPASHEQEELALWNLTCALLNNGQIIDRSFSIVSVRGGYKAVVGLPEEDSLQRRLFSCHVRDDLRALTKADLRLGPVRIIGLELESDPVCACRTWPAFILETNFLSAEVPLRCGGCGGVVPLYRISHTSEYGTYEDVRGWVNEYQTLDQLWINSSMGERFAYRQLSRHDSELSKDGRDLCRCIEKKTGVPTYYYLYRYYGRSLASEHKRRCPGCGKKWLVEPAWMNRYEFRCDRCRLVSEIASNVR
ncbi:MAG: DUF2310 family Zn-ribbon-containing protein [Phycisphaerae bacterium]|nr:DUF2310 family Zn-ribbon-containing protein [Phycisphaerae bacterium]